MLSAPHAEGTALLSFSEKSRGKKKWDAPDMQRHLAMLVFRPCGGSFFTGALSANLISPTALNAAARSLIAGM